MIYKDVFIGFCFLIFTGFCFSADLLAGELTPFQVAERVQAVYDATSSMSAGFTQITSSPMSRRKKEGSGKMILLKPGKMRWDYDAPYKQVIVCDGTNILMYFARERQMLVSAAKQYLESDVAYSFFAGNGNLSQDFEVSYPTDVDLGFNEDQTVLKIIPKGQHPQIDYILLWSGKNYLVTKIMVIDKFGSKTEITFTDIQLNATISEDSFSFTPPEGTEIISN